MTLYKLKQVFGNNKKDVLVYYYKDDILMVKELKKLYFRGNTRVPCVKVDTYFSRYNNKIQGTKKVYYLGDLTQKEKDLCNIIDSPVGDTLTGNYIVPTFVDDEFKHLGFTKAIEIGCNVDFNI